MSSIKESKKAMELSLNTIIMFVIIIIALILILLFFTKYGGQLIAAWKERINLTISHAKIIPPPI